MESPSYTCPQCLKSCSSHQSLGQHLKNKHNDPTYYNDWKKNEKTQKENTKIQEAKNQGKEICNFPHCGKILPTFQSLAQHCKNSHNINLVGLEEMLFEESGGSAEHNSGDPGDPVDPVGSGSSDNPGIGYPLSLEISLLEDFSRAFEDLKLKFVQITETEPNTLELFKFQLESSHHIAWKGFIFIETMLKELARNLRFNKTNSTWGNYLNHLKLVGVIKDDLYTDLWELKILRNCISHTPDVIVTQKRTSYILGIANKVLEILKKQK